MSKPLALLYVSNRFLYTYLNFVLIATECRIDGLQLVEMH